MLIPCSLADAKERLGIALPGGEYLPAVIITAGHMARKPRPAKDARSPCWGGEHGKGVPSMCRGGRGAVGHCFSHCCGKILSWREKGLILAQNLRVQSIMRESLRQELKRLITHRQESREHKKVCAPLSSSFLFF